MARREGGEHRRDERWDALKRRVRLLARLDGDPLWIDGVLHLVKVSREGKAATVKDVAGLFDATRASGTSLAALQRGLELDEAPVRLTRELVATARRDLKAVSAPPALELAKEHRRALARFGTVDAAWVAAKSVWLDVLHERLVSASCDGLDAFDHVLDLVRLLHGAAQRAAVEDAATRLATERSSSRKVARARIDALASAVESGETPADPDLAEPFARLRRAAELPGRARRARMLEVLHQVVGLGTKVAVTQDALPASLGGAAFARAIREAALPMLGALPSSKVARTAGTWLRTLSILALSFPLGDDGLPFRSIADLEPIAAKLDVMATLAGTGITLASAATLLAMPLKSFRLRRAAQWVAEGLPLSLLAAAVKDGHTEDLLQCANVRAARAYATWAARLVPHYRSLGVDFELTPELFANLPRNEDAAMLAVCLVDEALPKKKKESDADEPEAKRRDPIAVLDATLGLFQKLPQKAKGLLARLKGTTPGAGKTAFPELAAWLDDDALLDRYVHLARIAGMPVTLSKTAREDFEHAAKVARERAHLLSLPARHARQEARLATLLATERTREGSPRARTRRRLAERIDQLLSLAYRHELDATFREIMRDAWGINVPRMTPAWRDVVRFWLVVDDNRELLARLLRHAADTPGREVKSWFVKNDAWIAKASRTLDLAAWLGPHRSVIEAAGKRYELTLEEDPVEVLRMGVPFATCLSLEDGFNAASTVLNAVEANKRVLYVRGKDGKVVARQLLAISSKYTLLGYRLYLSTRGPEERAIREAVLALAHSLSNATGAPLGHEGEPENLHGGFWYDDGAVPWGEDVDVAAYCDHLGLTPPAASYDELAVEARAHAAMASGNVESAIGALTRWNDGPVNTALGAWIVDRLGERVTIRRARENDALVPPLLRALAEPGESGVVRALEVATRLDEQVAAAQVSRILLGYPRSERIAAALVELAVRAARLPGERIGWGFGYTAAVHLERFLDGVETAFDHVDRAAPAWETIALRSASPAVLHGAASEVIPAIVAAYAREPEPEAVVACLLSKHRSELAQRAALAIAAGHELPGGARAVSRLRARRPALAASPEMVAAERAQAGIAPEVLDAEAEAAAVAAAAERARIGPLTADRILAGWKDEATRGALITAMATRCGDDWWRYVASAERAALAAGELEVTDGLQDALVLAMATKAQTESLAQAESLDQLRAVVRVIVSEGDAVRAVELYKELLDEQSAALFLKQVRRQPRDRAAALRDAAGKLRFAEGRAEARKAWLLATRPLKKRRASSIEPG